MIAIPPGQSSIIAGTAHTLRLTHSSLPTMLVAFYKLPISLLLTLFLIAFTRSSVASPTATAALKPPLTKDDFASTISKGVWLVEFFSPYCGHCRAFAPTWQKLVEHSEMSAGVQLARVDCSVSGDLCDANNVKGYPQMNLYREGAFVEPYRGSRDLNLLTSYLAKHAPTQDPSLSVASMHRPNPIFSQSDVSAASPTTVALKLPLTKDNFASTLAKGYWLVEFFSPHGGHCRVFAQTWNLVAHGKMSASAGLQLARVDCSVSGDLCEANNVKEYPQINLYGEGGFMGPYRGPRDCNMLPTYLLKHAPTQVPSSSVAPMHRPDPIFSQGDVKSPLTQHNINDTIANGFWFVQYYTPWCGHCKRFAPTWDKLIAHSDGVQFARVDCDASRDLCTANKVRGYPQLDLYRDGELVETYRGGRTFDLIIKYLAAATRTSPPAPILNLNGEVAILSPDNFTAMVSQGPAFVSFYPKYCHDCGQLAPIWTQLATIMQQRVTVAEVRCGDDDDVGFCAAYDITLRAAHEPTLIYFPSNDGAVEVTYTGPHTLAQLRAFVDVGGVYPPPAMEFSRDTYQTVKAAPVTVMATVGTEGTIESVAASVHKIAAEWYSARGPSGWRTVQFAWEDPTRYEDVVRAPVYGEVVVMIVDHEAGSPGYGKIYLTEESGEQLQLTATSIFSVLEDVAYLPPSSVPSRQTEVEESVESIAEQAMRYLYAADAYVVAHPLKTLYWLSMSLAVVYLAFQRCLRAESELRYDADKGVLG